jgi:hypothetical protein
MPFVAQREYSRRVSAKVLKISEQIGFPTIENEL